MPQIEILDRYQLVSENKQKLEKTPEEINKERRAFLFMIGSVGGAIATISANKRTSFISEAYNESHQVYPENITTEQYENAQDIVTQQVCFDSEKVLQDLNPKISDACEIISTRNEGIEKRNIAMEQALQKTSTRRTLWTASAVVGFTIFSI